MDKQLADLLAEGVPTDPQTGEHVREGRVWNRALTDQELKLLHDYYADKLALID